MFTFLFLTSTAHADLEEIAVNTPAQVEDFIIYMAMERGVSIPLALAIAKCESGLNPLAKNPDSTASGIFQFIRSTWKYVTQDYLLWGGTPNVFDAKLNIIAGIALLKEEGVTPWESSRSCWGKIKLSPQGEVELP